MANYSVQLLNFLDANVKVQWDMVNTELPPVGVKVNLWAVAPGSKSSILSTAQHCIILQNQVLQQTWEVKWLPLGTHRSTGWPMWQWKVLKFLGLWLPFFCSSRFLGEWPSFFCLPPESDSSRPENNFQGCVWLL